jgi:replicative DNA helicase
VISRATPGQSTPHNLDAERSVLGACLLDSTAAAAVAGLLKPQDFYVRKHEIVFAAILAAYETKQATDPILVGEELRRQGRLDEAGGHDELLDLLEAVVTGADVRYHAEIVREHARRRFLLNLAIDIKDRVESGEDSDGVFTVVTLRLDDASASRGTSTALEPADLLRQWEIEGPLVHVPTGIRSIDDLTGGGPPFGARCYVLGAPDGGKTAFVVHVADHFLSQGILVGILAVDEEPGDVLMRFLQRRGFPRQACEQRDKRVLKEMARTLADAGLVFYGEEHTIESAAKDLAVRAKRQGRRAALFIDSVQTARSDREIEGASMHVAVTARVRAIRKVTAEYGFITYVTSEMGRAFYRAIDSADRGSDMAAAKESGSIEYSARFMVSMRSVVGESDLAEVRITKNKFGSRTRDGEPGIFLRLNRAEQKFTEDSEFAAQATADPDEQRAVDRSQRVNADAAVLAIVIVDDPGIATTDAEEEFRRRAKCGTRRWNAAKSMLRRAIFEQPAPRNRLSLYLHGSKVPPEVMALVPLNDRVRVGASDPNVELHRAAPSATTDAGAPHLELHHHHLRSRGGAAGGCRSKKGRTTPHDGGAGREGDEEP